jgi:hypothetical protein
MMNAASPHHTCVIAGCGAPTPPGAVFCAAHCFTEFGDADLYFPEAESLSPTARLEINPEENSCRAQRPVSGDAGNRKESHEQVP